MLYRILDCVEKKIASLQGRGYVAPLKKELSCSSRFLSGAPKVIVDIGGNKGEYSQEVLRLYPDVNLHIFEPSTKNVELLNAFYKNRDNVCIVDKALSDKVGHAVLYADEDGSGMGSLINRRLEHFGVSFSEQQTVQVIRFEDYWRLSLNEAAIDFVKIDVEGNELNVLTGFGQALEKTRVVQFEFGGTCIDARVFFQDYWRFFSDANFTIYRITPFGAKRIDSYRESDEVFIYTNYIAVNRNISNV